MRGQISPPRPYIESQMGLNPIIIVYFFSSPSLKFTPHWIQNEFSPDLVPTNSPDLVTKLDKSYQFIWMNDQSQEKKEEGLK